jgi:hypothetical protein
MTGLEFQPQLTSSGQIGHFVLGETAGKSHDSGNYSRERHFRRKGVIFLSGPFEWVTFSRSMETEAPNEDGHIRRKWKLFV